MPTVCRQNSSWLMIGHYEELPFTDQKQAVAALKMTETIQRSVEQLYKELCASWEEIHKAGQDTTESSGLWQFSKTQRKPTWSACWRLSHFFLSVPGSNAFTERILPLMTIKWSDSRNRCSTKRNGNEHLWVVAPHVRTPHWLCKKTEHCLISQRGESCPSFFFYLKCCLFTEVCTFILRFTHKSLCNHTQVV